MDRTERLTSYLDGELDIDERRALEAELAEDASLRAELTELERGDELLRSLPPTELPDGARERLDEALAPVLSSTRAGAEPETRQALAQAPTTSEAMGGKDELARRRERRRGLLPALAGVAAAAAVIAVGVTTIGPLGQMGGDDATDESADSMTAMDTDEAGEDSAEVETARAPEPVVIDDGRRLSEEELDELLATDALREITARGLDEEQGAALARDYQQQLLAGAAPGGGDEETTEDGAADDSADEGTDDSGDADAEAEAETVEPVAPLVTTRDGRTLAPEDAEAVTRCLGELLASGEQAIPVTVELLEVDGAPAIAFGMVTLDPETAEFTRSEVWTLARSDCQPIRFAQS